MGDRFISEAGGTVLGSSVLAPSSDALLLVASLLLVVRPGAPSSVLAPSSKARSP